MVNSKFYTFLLKGLTSVEIKLLSVLEEMFFEGKEISTKLFLTAYKKCGYKVGGVQARECLNAWNYWRGLNRPIYRESYKKPIKLSELFNVTNKSKKLIINRKTNNAIKGTYIGKEFSTVPKCDYYFELFGNNHLYMQYESIIGSRFIAIIENDLGL